MTQRYLAQKYETTSCTITFVSNIFHDVMKLIKLIELLLIAYFARAWCIFFFSKKKFLENAVSQIQGCLKELQKFYCSLLRELN